MHNIGINGFGRIGRTIFREWLLSEKKTVNIQGLNNVFKQTSTDQIKKGIESLIHLLKYDSTHGVLSKDFELKVVDDNGLFYLHVENKKVNQKHYVRFFTEQDPDKIDWSSENIELVVDSTGVFKTKDTLGKHLKGSVKKVIMSAPGDNLDATFVMGVNHQQYDKTNHHIVSNASCTTNCLAPIVKVLDDKFKLKIGMMNTIHSFTMDQSLVDNVHSDLRRARGATQSMIPTTTGAAKAIGEVLPHLKGKLDGTSIRVPTPNVSVVDLTAIFEKPVSKQLINEALKEASLDPKLQKILGYTDEPLVSIDFNGDTHSSTVDSQMTQVISLNETESMVKVLSWYDNESGYSNRVLDLATHMLK